MVVRWWRAVDLELRLTEADTFQQLVDDVVCFWAREDPCVQLEHLAIFEALAVHETLVILGEIPGTVQWRVLHRAEHALVFGALVASQVLPVDGLQDRGNFRLVIGKTDVRAGVFIARVFELARVRVVLGLERVLGDIVVIEVGLVNVHHVGVLLGGSNRSLALANVIVGLWAHAGVGDADVVVGATGSAGRRACCAVAHCCSDNATPIGGVGTVIRWFPATLVQSNDRVGLSVMPGQLVVFGDLVTRRTVSVASELVVLCCCCSDVALLFLFCCCSAVALLSFCCCAAVVLLLLSNDHGQSDPVRYRKITRRQIRWFQE
jgi:hypothetical protein